MRQRSRQQPIHLILDGGVTLARAGLQAKIEARQPFLDITLCRANLDGSRQQFRVSGEPMFNTVCRFLGYRGIGVEVTAGH